MNNNNNNNNNELNKEQHIEKKTKQKNKKSIYIILGIATCIIILLTVTMPSVIDVVKTKDNDTEEKNNNSESEEQIDDETTVEDETQTETPNEQKPEQTPNSTETYEKPSGPTKPIETSGNITQEEIKKYSRLINSFIINTKTNDDSVTYLIPSVANYHFEDFIKNTNEFKNLVTMNFVNWTKSTGETICSQENLKSALVCTDDAIKYNLNGYATKVEVDKVSQELFGINANEIEPFYDGYYGEWYYDKDKKIYYQGHPRGGGTGAGLNIFYKSKFEKTNNNIYVYMVAAAMDPANFETGDYKVYKSILKTTEAEEYGTYNERSNVFKITKENYKDFEEYKITFKKHDTLDTYYLENVEKTK